MVSKITEGVKVSVETFYQQDYSNPLQSEYMFAYRITIKNGNMFPIRLLTRHWHIVDADGAKREVEGEGVIGMQPLIAIGDEYQYVSGVNLHCEMGHMYGIYLMQNWETKDLFEVKVPNFEMYTPFKLN